ncbi:MAG: DUF2764 family protein [Kiritimatiellae bacterium]|nr:DUF2764 family protein [Kiritimatiellia bacterium]
MNYYYLIASLPGFTIEDPPPMPPDQFRDLCDHHLTPGDMQAMDELLSNATNVSGNDFLKQWLDFETQIRNAIATIRATRLNKNVSEHLKGHKGFDPETEKAVSDAFSKNTPMEREKVLDEFRWGRIEDMAGLNPFAARALLAYTLKLILAKRWSQMNKENGTRRADEIIRRNPSDKENGES